HRSLAGARLDRDRHVGAELVQHLPAPAAGRRRLAGGGPGAAPRARPLPPAGAAFRSAHTDIGYDAFSTFAPANTSPSARTAAPTLKFEYGAYEPRSIASRAAASSSSTRSAGALIRPAPPVPRSWVPAAPRE